MTRLLLVFMAVGAIGAATATPAQATPVQDTTFLSMLDRQGITYASATKVVTAAYSVCEMRDAGFTEMETAQKVYEATPLDAYSAGFFVGAAELVYCGWHYEGGQSDSLAARRLI